jgi:hypothetical protein
VCSRVPEKKRPEGRWSILERVSVSSCYLSSTKPTTIPNLNYYKEITKNLESHGNMSMLSARSLG